MYRRILDMPLGALLRGIAVGLLAFAVQPRAQGDCSGQTLPAGLIDPTTSAIVITDDGQVLGAQSANDRRYMASTTKVMTAYIALARAHLPASDPRHLDLDESVLIGFGPSQMGGSLLRDVSGAPLVFYESIQLRDLLYGMMLPSGNNAAAAVAETILGQLSFSSDEADDLNDEFADLMNGYASTLGLDDTLYQNPAGIYEEYHYTTACDLVTLFRRAMENPFFAEMVATRYDCFSTSYLWVTRSYQISHTLESVHDAFDDNPGFLGGKTGTWSGRAAARVVGARRLGRTVYAALLREDSDSTRINEEVTAVLDHAFTQLLDIRPVGYSGVQAGDVSEIAITRQYPSRVVTAVRDGGGRVKVITWTDSGGYIGFNGDSASQGETAGEVTIGNGGLNEIITAIRDVNGRVKLIGWSVAAGGAVTRVGDSGSSGPIGTQVCLRMLNSSLAVTAHRRSTGTMQLTSWTRSVSGAWTQAYSRTYSPTNQTVQRLAITTFQLAGGPDGGTTAWRVVAATSDSAGDLRASGWEVSSTGVFSSWLGSAPPIGLSASEVRVFYGPHGTVTTAARDAAGTLKLFNYRVEPSGDLTFLNDSADQGGTASQISVEGLGETGVLTAVRDEDGGLKLIAWDLCRSIYSDCSDDAPAVDEVRIKHLDDRESALASRVAIRKLSAHRYVTAIKNSAGDLQLLGWNIDW